jgi:phosphate transport system protein
MDEKLEEKAFQLIALYQPMAKDMRTIGCCLKIITYLARIGRYGKDIAKITKEISNESHVSKLISIPHMNEMVCSMVNDALKAFKTEELSLISDFSERDDDIDALRYSIFRECLTYMMEDPKKINRCAHYMIIARYLERCGDHACKMAEKIHYMITGERIEIK